MSYLFLVLAGAPLMMFALSSRKHLIYYVLATAAIPVTMLVPNTTFLSVVGGVNAQAAYLLLICVALSIAALRTKEKSSARRQVLFPFIVFLSFSATSLLWSADPVHGLRFLVKLVTPVLVLFVASSVIRSDEDLEKAQRMILLGCSLVLGLAIVNLAFDGAIGGQEVRSKWLARGYLAAPYMGPAPFSFLMSMGAIICVAKYVVYKDPKSGIFAAIFLSAIILAFTRISLGGIVIAGGAFSLILGRNAFTRYVIPVLLVSSFTLTLFLYEPLRSRMFFPDANVALTSALSNPESVAKAINSSGRTALWQAASRQVGNESRLVGGGLGTTDGWLARKLGGEQLHSGFLTLYFDLGIVGLSLYVLALLNAIMCCYRMKFAVPQKRHKVHQACGLAALVFYAVTLVTDNSITYVTEIGVYVFAFVAMTAVVARNERQLRRRRSDESDNHVTCAANDGTSA